jgi:hypothetical protein
MSDISNQQSELPDPYFEATTVSFLTSSLCFNSHNILQQDQEAKRGHLAANCLSSCQFFSSVTSSSYMFVCRHCRLSVRVGTHL